MSPNRHITGAIAHHLISEFGTPAHRAQLVDKEGEPIRHD
jgi:hypothetical protein